MINLFTNLKNLWTSSISCLEPDQPEIESEDDQTGEPVNECEQVRKQLQQTNTSLSILLFQAFTEYKQRDKQLNDTTTENESLKQAVRELNSNLKPLNANVMKLGKSQRSYALRIPFLNKKLKS
jgi:chromosome segregation ATPase